VSLHYLVKLEMLIGRMHTFELLLYLVMYDRIYINVLMINDYGFCRTSVLEIPVFPSAFLLNF